MEKLKKYFIMMTLAVMAFQLTTFHLPAASALPAIKSGDIVINEIAWAGTADNWRDEWIELYNNTDYPVDLSGWRIEDDRDRTYLIEDGEIPARGYFLIADKEESLSNVQIDAVITLSLVDTGNSLTLKTSEDFVIDVVNESAGAWYAGSASTRATMERIDPLVSGNVADNWASAVSGNGAKGRDGADILGTPRGVNSVYDGDGAEVSFSPDVPVIYNEKFIKLSVVVDAVEDLYAYGFDINYDSEILKFAEANESDFLKEQGVSTAFYSALMDGQEGRIIVGNARLLNPPSGIGGAGELFDVHFEILEPDADETSVSFGAGSFLADSDGDMTVKLTGTTFPLGETAEDVPPVTGLQSEEGEDRYSIVLNWNDSDADSYSVMKKMHDGEFAVIGTTEKNFFTDYQYIVPHYVYDYRVVPVKNGVSGTASEISGVETRGLKGDNNRSDSVDGRDIENLARAFGSQYGDSSYNPLADTNFDGIIDGSDLIDIGMNFGLTYQP